MVSLIETQRKLDRERCAQGIWNSAVSFFASVPLGVACHFLHSSLPLVSKDVAGEAEFTYG